MKNLLTMKKTTKNLLAKSICLTLLVSLLTMTVGRVQRVQAMATVATAAVSAAITIGATVLVYEALTGATLSLPSANEATMEQWLQTVGSEAIASSPFLLKQYNKMYQYCLDHPNDWTSSLILEFDQDLLKGVYNDLKSVDTLQSITGYYLNSSAPTTAYDYSNYTIQPYTTHVEQFSPYGWSSTSLEDYIANGYTVDFGSGYRIFGPYIKTGSYLSVFRVWGYELMRNLLKSNGRYGIQAYVDGQWTTLTQVDYCVRVSNGTTTYYAFPYNNSEYRSYENTITYANNITNTVYPSLLDADIYVEASGEIIPTVQTEDGRYVPSPEWQYPNDDPKLPYVPYVPLPTDPTTGQPLKWGVPFQNLLNQLANLAGDVLDASVIASLFNALAGDSTLNVNLEYSPYTDNSQTYYVYYSDSYNVNDYSRTYNYDISDQDELMPVNLNEIELYVDNKYIDSVLDHAESFSSTIGEYVGFWFNSDNELVIVLLGCSIFTLVCAFIGKWGHS